MHVYIAGIVLFNDDDDDQDLTENFERYIYDMYIQHIPYTLYIHNTHMTGSRYNRKLSKVNLTYVHLTYTSYYAINEYYNI